jgi:death-on-curing protein
MAKAAREPRWLSRQVVDAIQNEQIREHGGLPGLRDDTALESALARPQRKWHDGDERDVVNLAAAYGFGLARNHPYRDGNKRMAFLAIVTFLGMNGYTFDTSDEDVVTQIVQLAAGELSETRLADWIRRQSKQRDQAPRTNQPRLKY